MTDTPDPIGELIERLRKDHKDLLKLVGFGSRTVSGEAADSLSALQGQVRELKDQHYQIMLLVCGGEDAPGFAASLGVKDVEQIMQQNREFSEYDTATIASLRDALHKYRVAQSKMLARWADGDENVKRQLWKDLHSLEEGALDLLDKTAALAREPDIGTTEEVSPVVQRAVDNFWTERNAIEPAPTTSKEDQAGA